jgi:alkylation response protein AidB-like acyl-CoA dehydrogenase
MLSGKKSFVIDGAAADLVLVVARSTAGPALFAVDRGAPGLRAEPMTTLDPTRPMAALTFGRTPAVLVGADGQGGRLMSRVLDLACVALARFQFGRPIGSFQAVKHKCADMLVRVELAEATAREAARLTDEAAPESAVAAATAHVICSQAYMFAAAENIHVHGGIGFTWEHPAHLYFRRAKSSELLFGGPAVYHERLLDRLGI